MSSEESVKWIVSISPTMKGFVTTLRELADISHEAMEAYWSAYEKNRTEKPEELQELKERIAKATGTTEQDKTKVDSLDSPDELRDFERLIKESMDSGLTAARELDSFLENGEVEHLIEAQGSLSEAVGQTIITTTELGKMLQAAKKEASKEE